MFGRGKLFIDQDEFDWLLACFAWGTREFSAVKPVRGSPVVLPDNSFYPSSGKSGHDYALDLFERTKTLAWMHDWPCDLVAGAGERERRVTTGHALRHHTSQPLGTFGYANGRYVISYNPVSIGDPQTLIATFAHELSHYLIHTAETRSPGGSALAEHATDLGAVYLGFGLFMANSARTFRQFDGAGEHGWEMRGAGYLSEHALVTALAMFVRLSGDTAQVERELKPYLRAVYRKTLAAIDRKHPDLAASVAAVDLTDWA